VGSHSRRRTAPLARPTCKIVTLSWPRFDTYIASAAATIPAARLSPGVDEIFFPGELEDRNTWRHRAQGISVADQTWQSLAKLSAETDTALPTANGA
jgi:LDH2 family malate/lactate/ureidoglycolate dehydrogenase